MESYHKELILIKKILRDRSKGMTVTDISKKIKVNRNSVAKYLDILLVSGQAEMITFGPAKVYFPSRRVPISSLLNLSTDYIIIFDKNLKIVEANNSFLILINADRQELIGQRIEDLEISLSESEQLISSLKEALNGNDKIKEISFHISKGDLYFKIKILSTSFEDGDAGAAIIIKDITELKRVQNALRKSEDRFKEIFEKIKKGTKT